MRFDEPLPFGLHLFLGIHDFFFGAIGSQLFHFGTDAIPLCVVEYIFRHFFRIAERVVTCFIDYILIAPSEFFNFYFIAILQVPFVVLIRSFAYVADTLFPGKGFGILIECTIFTVTAMVGNIFTVHDTIAHIYLYTLLFFGIEHFIVELADRHLRFIVDTPFIFVQQGRANRFRRLCYTVDTATDIDLSVCQPVCQIHIGDQLIRQEFGESGIMVVINHFAVSHHVRNTVPLGKQYDVFIVSGF